MRGGTSGRVLFSAMWIWKFACGGPSTSNDPGHRERSSDGDLERVFGDVLAYGTALDPPEKLLRAMLLQAFYSIRSERQLMERLEFDLLFRWFVGIGVDDAVWDHSTFSKNRDRLLEGEVAAKLLNAFYLSLA